jgi:hypothetical protein
VYSEKPPVDRWRNCPKHVEFHARLKVLELVHLVGFVIKKFVTMQHGHRNVKFLPHVGFVIHSSYKSLHYSTLAIKDADK